MVIEEHLISTKIDIVARIAPEVSLKSSRVCKAFVQRLIRNMKDACTSHGFTVDIRQDGGRLRVQVDQMAAVPVLERIFGLHSVAIIQVRCAPTIEAMREVVKTHYMDLVAGKTFAVRCQRNKVAGMKSCDVERDLGAVLYPASAGVSLKNPEVQVSLDLRLDGAHFYTDRRHAGGGLPIGVEGRALCLISGGFDSAVAAWYLLRRGVELDFMFCNLAGAAYERSVMSVTAALAKRWCYGYRPKLFSVPFNDIVSEIRTKTKENYSQVVLKRLMYKAGEKLAAKIGAEALITGEAVGQVSSQTLHNLRAIDDAVEIPVFRPLIGFDKEEIIAKSRFIGTQPFSEHVKEYCNITPKFPVTKGVVGIARAEDRKVDESFIDAALSEMKTTEMRSIEGDELLSDFLFTREIKDDSVVVHCVDKDEHLSWQWPGSQTYDAEQLMKNFTKLNKDNNYILVCSYGLQSAVLAEKMQDRGYEAYSYAGGLGELRKSSDSMNLEPPKE